LSAAWHACSRRSDVVVCTKVRLQCGAQPTSQVKSTHACEPVTPSSARGNRKGEPVLSITPCQHPCRRGGRRRRAVAGRGSERSAALQSGDVGVCGILEARWRPVRLWLDAGHLQIVVAARERESTHAREGDPTRAQSYACLGKGAALAQGKTCRGEARLRSGCGAHAEMQWTGIAKSAGSAVAAAAAAVSLDEPSSSPWHRSTRPAHVMARSNRRD
jgi:hypothetical protein